MHSLDWSSLDGKHKAYTKLHPDWQETLNPASFVAHCRQRYGIDANGDPVTVPSSGRSKPDAPEIEFDSRGEPSLPEEDESIPWKRVVQEQVIRNFMTEHYRELHFNDCANNSY